jgi:hypothetical protein
MIVQALDIHIELDILELFNNLGSLDQSVFFPVRFTHILHTLHIHFGQIYYVLKYKKQSALDSGSLIYLNVVSICQERLIAKTCGRRKTVKMRWLPWEESVVLTSSRIAE